MADLEADVIGPARGARAHRRFVFQAAAAGAIVASFVTTLAFVVDVRLHTSAGPFDFSGAGTIVTAFGLSLIVGGAISLLALFGALAICGVARLATIPTPVSAVVGATVGAGLTWLALGLFAGDWLDASTIAIGALYGACVAGFWSHLVRR
jgi:hypothetical protein